MVLDDHGDPEMTTRRDGPPAAQRATELCFDLLPVEFGVLQ